MLCRFRLPLVAFAVFWFPTGVGAERPKESVEAGTSEAAVWDVYVGTYTRGDSKGIYRLRLDGNTGKLQLKGLAAETTNPSFLAVAPDQRRLYAVNEVASFGDEPGGSVTAFVIDSSGKLEEINVQPSGGAAPCHLVVDRLGKHVLVANYSGGSVAVLPLGEDGRLEPRSSFQQHEGSSVHPQRQRGPHAHSIHLDADNRFAFAADLGLDQVLIYQFDAERGSLTPHDPPAAHVEPGSGPRHFAFHPSGQFAYVNNELTSTVTAFSYDAKQGTLEELQTLSTLPAEFEGNNSTAEILVHPNGRTVYVSNRGHDSIAVFAVEPDTGRLVTQGHTPTQGRTPRNFCLDPTGSWLLAANQNSDSIVVLRVDASTGQLEPTGYRVEVPAPVCLRMVPAGP